MTEGQSRVVLVVDDSSEVREYYQRILRRAGYRVVLAGEGERALEVVRQIRPDCIVLDVMMPELDGISLLERLPEEVPRVPPVVVTSGFEWPEVEALARGARFFLRKPLAQEDLVACVQAAIGGKTLPDPERARISGAAEQTRADWRAARDRLLDGVDLEAPALRVPLADLVKFVSGWFGFGLAAVHLARHGKMHVEAVAGEPQAAHQLAVGASVDQGLTWCAQVVEGGSALLIGDASRKPMLAQLPPARAGASFYAGVPVPTHGGLVLGTLCLIDHEEHALHSEDMAVLEHCGQAIGRRLEAMSTGAATTRMIVEAPGLLTRHGLHMLVDAQLRAARRQRAAVELTLFEVGGAVPLEELAQAVYDVTGRRGVGVARFGERVLAVLNRGGAPETLRATNDELLGQLAQRSPILGAGVVTCEVGDAAIVPASQLERLADEARERALLSGGIERVVLRREPSPLHAA